MIESSNDDKFFAVLYSPRSKKTELRILKFTREGGEWKLEL